ncbi:MAG TPA: hypothetical protein VGF31_05925 [Myxococcaceae bacterium]
MQQDAEILTLDEADFVPLEEFELLWRWVSHPGHAELPQHVLETIRPLAATRRPP